MSDAPIASDTFPASKAPAIILMLVAVVGIVLGILGLHSATSSQKAIEELQAKLDKQRGGTEEIENEVRLLAGQSQNSFGVMTHELGDIRNQVTNYVTQAEAAATAKANPEVGKKGDATPSDPHGTYHTVRAGELLGHMAKQYGTTIDKIMELNPGLDPRHIKRGQKVRVR